jgi:antitoxin FitA
MASITIRNLPDKTKDVLRVRAAQEGVSLEAYVRNLLQRVSTSETSPSTTIVDLARKYFGPKNGVDLELPSRRTHREPPEFDA